MKNANILLAVAALLFSSVMARKSYLVKEEHRGRIPKIRATTYPQEIVYQNFDDDITLFYQAKTAAAWEWDQTMAENQDSSIKALPDVYHLTLDIFINQSVYFSPVINMPRLVYLEPILELQEFRFGYKLDIAYFWIYPDRKDLICISGFFSLSPIKLISTLVIRIQECYKTLINCIYNFKNWESEDSKFFEKCSQSGKTSITMLEKDWEAETFGTYGGTDDAILRTGQDCNPGTGWWPIAIGDIQTHYISNLVHYIAAESGFEGGQMDLIDIGSDARRVETSEYLELLE